jgi:hypothetical protein
MNNFENLLSVLATEYPTKTVFKNSELKAVTEKTGYSWNLVYHNLLKKESEKVSRGVWNLEAKILPFRDNRNSTPNMSFGVESVVNNEIFVPDADETYVSWGNYSDIKKIISSGMFYPTFITGLSGNGKTMMVEQACAKLNREYIRVQITPETDEDDLIGGFRMINGETVFQSGPVIKAMEAGSILLIDEIDRGSNRLMALQGVIEGKPVLIKKTGKVVRPAPGFNIIATANTKGQGSETGDFVSATILDEAFLERFSITVEQPYPSPSIEKKIILNHMKKYGKMDEEFASNLTVWSEVIRKTYMDGGVDSLVSTRRLCHIVQSFAIFEDKKKAIDLCINRFDSDTIEAFKDLYSKIDSGEEETVTQSVDDIVDSIFN